MHKTALIIITLLLGSSLGGCGVKDDLYLPEAPAELGPVSGEEAPATLPEEESPDEQTDG